MFRYQLFTVLKSVKATCIEIYSGGSRGRAREGGPPQCLDQTDRESRRPKKKKHLEGLFFEPKSSHTRFNVFFPLPLYCESYLVIREISNSVVI